MPRIGLFYALARHSAISMRPPILLRCYLSCRPAPLTGNHLRSFGTAIGSRVSELGIDEVDRLINKESSLLCDMVEAFIKSPEPPDWIPPISNHEFLRNLRIPSYLNNSPNLLFHDLAVCNSDEIEEIFGQRRHVYVVISCTLNPSHYLITGSFATHQDREKPGACWKVSRNTGASTLLQRRISIAWASRIWQTPYNQMVRIPNGYPIFASSRRYTGSSK
jgi:hypothetical protein